LTAEFGGGFGYATVNRAIQFAQFFPDPAIVSTLSTQLSWSHFIELLPIKDPLARDLYAEMCRIERSDVRTLRQNYWNIDPAATAYYINAYREYWDSDEQAGPP